MAASKAMMPATAKSLERCIGSWRTKNYKLKIKKRGEGLFKVFQGDFPLSVLYFLNGHFDGITRQKLLYQLRPFYEAEGAAVEVIFVTHVIHFFQFLDAVEVEW